MGHGHSAHAGGVHRWRLVASLLLAASFLTVEVVAAAATGSLALLSDAGHMSADVVALGAALAATHLAVRADRSGRRTYGRYRAEIFASGFIALLMLAVAAYVVMEAISRWDSPVQVPTTPVLIVGALGLVVNLVALALLSGGAAESLSVRGAYAEVIADAAGSVGVLVAAGLVAITGDSFWDAVLALIIGAFVAVRGVVLGRQVLAVLGQQVPDGMDIAQVAERLEAIDGVVDVHDLHAWTLTSGMHVATAHLVVARADGSGDVLAAAQSLLRRQYGVEHATLQVEDRPSAHCQELSW